MFHCQRLRDDVSSQFIERNSSFEERIEEKRENFKNAEVYRIVWG